MNKTKMDDLLRGSASRPLSAQTIASNTISDLFENVQLDAPRRRRRTLVIALPVAVLAAGALTAGGIAIATFDWTGEVDVPIIYTTDSGRALTCTAVIQTGAAIDADARALKGYLKAHDWTGVGQRIYDRALANPAPSVEGDTAGQSSAERDVQSWTTATFDVILAELSRGAVFGGPSSYSISTGNCTGELH
ncbi:MAG: hypothetical protein ACOH1T_08885 [Microbacteriaceae bacterium]